MQDRAYLDQQLQIYYEEERQLGHTKTLYLHRETRERLICRSVPAGSDLSVYRRLVGRTHRNLASVYDVIDDEAAPAVLLEYVPGSSLAQLLQEAPPSADAV